MTSHEEFQQVLPAFAASRLEGEQLRRVEAHLAECEPCGEIASAWQEIAPALREDGKELFAPHPDEATLRRFAGGERIPDPAPIVGHLKICASCELEVAAWKSLRKKPTAMKATFQRHRFAIPAFAAAAGIVIGVGLAILLRGTILPGTADRDQTKGFPIGASGWSGRVSQIVLPKPVRGDGPPIEISIDRSETLVVFGFQTGMPEGVKPGDMFRLEVALGEEIIWTEEVAAGWMSEQLESVGVVNLALPTALFSPGRYEFRVIPPAPAANLPWYRVEAEISIPD
jgi:hypothetical protein